ncbi:MAG: hypothetical protein AAGA40_07975 [Cyanobacteria bacterium P01_E01_bin.45]
MPDEMISLITYTPTTDPANAPSKGILGDAVSGDDSIVDSRWQ